jgi:hypothetical protein
MVESENSSEHVNYGLMEAIIRLPVECCNSKEGSCYMCCTWMLGWCLSVMTSCETQNFPSLLFRTAPCAILQTRSTFWYTCHRKYTSKQALKYPSLACCIFQFLRNVRNSLNILKSPCIWPSEINVLLRNIFCCNQAFRRFQTIELWCRFANRTLI